MFAAGHFLWPARELVEIPGKVVLDSTATQALTVQLDSVRAQLVLARESVAKDRAALSRARAMYADLTRRIDSLEALPDPGPFEWPVATFDTTAHHVTELAVQVGDSVEYREIAQEIRLSGKYIFPPVSTFRDISLHMTPSTFYYSRQLPGKTVETREVFRWQWLPAGLGYVAGTIITTLLFLLVQR